MLKLTKKQEQVLDDILDFGKEHRRENSLFYLMYGGSRSAKTAFACHYLQAVSLKYPNTRSIICRSTWTALKASIIDDTFPKMLHAWIGDKAYDKDVIRYHNSSPMYCQFGNNSSIYFLGLKDNSQFDKILGMGVRNFLIDEVSTVPYGAFSKMITRMSSIADASSQEQRVGFITINPTTQYHWAYKLFLDKINPQDDTPVRTPERFKFLQMNPVDNLENLPKDYIDNLENLSDADRLRFLHGEWSSVLENSVYKKQIERTKKEGRLVHNGNFKLNPSLPVYAAFDIGWDDFNSAWIYQIEGGGSVNFFAYLERQHCDIIDFITSVRDAIKSHLPQGHRWISPTKIYLPHDADNHWVGTGMTVKHILSMNAAVNRHEPISFYVLKKRGIYEGITSSRVIFSRCYFDESGCSQGFQRLSNYTEYLSDGLEGFSRALKHDKNSHAADAFRYAIQSFYIAPIPYESMLQEGKYYGLDLLRDETKHKMGVYY